MRQLICRINLCFILCFYLALSCGTDGIACCVTHFICRSYAQHSVNIEQREICEGRLVRLDYAARVKRGLYTHFICFYKNKWIGITVMKFDILLFEWLYLDRKYGRRALPLHNLPAAAGREGAFFLDNQSPANQLITTKLKSMK